MLLRQFGESAAVDDLLAAGLIKRRGWADGPGSVLVLTPEGEALAEALRTPARHTPTTRGDRVILPQRSS